MANIKTKYVTKVTVIDPDSGHYLSEDFTFCKDGDWCDGRHRRFIP